MNLSVAQWMSWEAGVDLAAATAPGFPRPNLIIHLARVVHTPVGSAPAGMILFQPDPAAAPMAFGCVSTNAEVGRYLGPKIFAGTPFENAPVLEAQIQIEIGVHHAAATIVTAGHEFKTRLDNLGSFNLVNREPGMMTPFTQQGIEAAAATAHLWVDGQPVPILVPPVGISGGPAAVYAPAGLYAR